MPSDFTSATATQDAAGRLLDAQGDVMNRAAAQTDQLIDSIRRQPVTAALVIFGIGYLLGKIT